MLPMSEIVTRCHWGVLTDYCVRKCYRKLRTFFCLLEQEPNDLKVSGNTLFFKVVAGILGA